QRGDRARPSRAEHRAARVALSGMRSSASLVRKHSSPLLDLPTRPMHLVQGSYLLALSAGGSADRPSVSGLPAALRMEFGARLGVDARRLSHPLDLHRPGTLAAAVCADHSRGRARLVVFAVARREPFPRVW